MMKFCFVLVVLMFEKTLYLFYLVLLPCFVLYIVTHSSMRNSSFTLPKEEGELNINRSQG